MDTTVELRHRAELKMNEESIDSNRFAQAMAVRTMESPSRNIAPVLARQPEIDQLIRRVEQIRSTQK